MRLRNFDESLGLYYQEVKEIESNVLSQFGKTSGKTEDIESLVSEWSVSVDGDIDSIFVNGKISSEKLRQLLLKDPSQLTDKEKLCLQMIRYILGDFIYNEIMLNKSDIVISADALSEEIELKLTVMAAEKAKIINEPITTDGEIDQAKLHQLMLKDPQKLTFEEKRCLDNIKNNLGSDNYDKLLEEVKSSTPRKIQVGESGDGFLGKVADAWVSSPVYDALSSVSDWQDNHPKTMFAINIATFVMSLRGSMSVHSEEAEIESVDWAAEAEYAYNMVDNPGVLAEMRGNPASNFLAGKYNIKVLDKDTILYRSGKVGGLTVPGEEQNALGQWFTREPAESVAKVRIDSAVKAQWIDPKTGELTGTSPLESTYAIKIPKETTIYEGPVGYQGGCYLGGENCNQIFISEPWKIKGVQPLSETPIK